MSNTLPAGFADALADIVGPGHVLTDAATLDVHGRDWRGAYQGRAALLVRPGDTAEVAAVVRAAAAAGAAIVPQGGNTSLCGASVPLGGGREIIVNLARMRRVRDVDAENDAITVEAGCLLAEVQAAAAAVGRLFPLSLAAEGSCQIGGNLSTNAGGVAVLRYGNTRELTLGLEVVLPDGRVWNGLRGLRKDNTGYDLKQLFIGAEGTLGIITAATLKLFPMPQARATAWVAVPGPAAAVGLLHLLRAHCGDRITGFELVSRLCLDLVLRHIPGAQDPLPAPSPWYVLAEAADGGADEALTALLSDALAAGLESGLASDAAMANSQAQAARLWALRENISEAQRIEGPSIKHDVSVPVSRVPELIDRAGAALAEAFPGARVVAFGHIGDGNIHYNISRPEGDDGSRFMAASGAVNEVVYRVVSDLDGSISAEHGVGQLKRAILPRHKDQVEMDLMRAVKQALDPTGRMNPGKVL